MRGVLLSARHRYRYHVPSMEMESHRSCVGSSNRRGTDEGRQPRDHRCSVCHPVLARTDRECGEKQLIIYASRLDLAASLCMPEQRGSGEEAARKQRTVRATEGGSTGREDTAEKENKTDGDVMAKGVRVMKITALLGHLWMRGFLKGAAEALSRSLLGLLITLIQRGALK